MSSCGLATSVKERMMHAIVVLLALTLATARSEIVTRLPADVPVTDGVAVNSICGNCCQEGAYCGNVSEDIVLAGATTPASNLLVPKGSNMTCVLRARNVFGAVDGGLCVPSLLPRHFPIENLCRAFDKALPPSHTLTEVVYQANLVEQESCGQCCDGYHVCGASDTCRPTPSRDGSFCVPNNATSRNYCGVSVLMNQEVSCESCDEPSPSAVVYESLFDEPESASSRRRLLTTSFAAAPSSGGFCYNNNYCKTYEVCKSGKCSKKPNFCENTQHCKAGYECKNNFCFEKVSAPTATPKATVNPTPAPTLKPTPKPTPRATVEATSKPTAAPLTPPKATPKATPQATPKAAPNATPKATPAPTPPQHTLQKPQLVQNLQQAFQQHMG